MRAILVSALALAVAGCGGGSGGTMTATAQLAGTVYEVDGQGTNVGGIPVVLKETGEWAFTDATGAFEFHGLEGGTYTLDFMGDSEGASGGDEFEDGDGDPKVDVPDGGHVECDVALEGGKVKDFSTDHEEGQYAMARLHMTDAGELEGYRLEGGIKIVVEGDFTLLKVCVAGFEHEAVLDIYVGEELIGTATVVEGRACLELERQLTADQLRELAGLRVDVYLHETGLRLMVGEVPALMEHHDDGGDDAADGGDKPGGDDAADGDGVKDDGAAGEGEGDGKDEPAGDGTPDGGDGTGEGTGGGDGAV